jgi:hypothetical protein
MPEVNQYLFNHKELLELMIKKADVHEGKWIVMANLGFSPGNFGPSPDQMSPGEANLFSSGLLPPSWRWLPARPPTCYLRAPFRLSCPMQPQPGPCPVLLA